MKKVLYYIIVLTIAFSCLCTSGSIAQALGNEWINYGQTYFKIKIGANGIYRIPQGLLQGNGMGNVTGAQFALYREGQQVPIFVSSSGVLSSSDYIEFYGTKANGKMDTELYTPASRQGSMTQSIISDTAVYFLTFGSPSSNTRLVLQDNILPANPPVAELFCTTTALPTGNPRASFSNGESYYTDVSQATVYHSGKFDKGEGPAYQQSSNVLLTIPITERYSVSNPSLVTSTFFYSKLNNRFFRNRVNNQVVFDTTINAYSLITKSVPFNQSFLQPNTPVRIQTEGGLALVFEAGIRYNRTFNFNNLQTLAFQVNGNGAVQRLTLNNLNPSKLNVVVDISSGNIYHLNADDHVMLSPMTGVRELFFGSDALEITTLAQVSFVDYTQAMNQGSYLILSDNEYINVPNGGISNYKNYRTSPAGGSYNVAIISVNDLYDQFGWGYEYHPLAIKRFLRYAAANNSWVNKPEYMFIVGKGISYNHINYYLQNRATLQYPVVPTFGNPGSDNLFAEVGTNSVPSIAIGRLSAMNDNEISNYLEKVKAYEVAQRIPSVPDLENSLWKKTALHIAGFDDVYQTAFYNSLNACKAILEDSLVGGIVHTTGKTTTTATESASARIDSLVEAGLQYVTFYGHASSSGFDYNLNNPEKVNSKPKFPIFLAFGCAVADIFEPTNSKAISEKYISEPNGGSIAMVACTNLGWVGTLELYMQGLYHKIGRDDYGKTFGKQYLSNLERMISINSGTFAQIHVQNFLLQGDPGLNVYNPEKADYYIDEGLLSSDPGIINTSMDSFKLNATVYNLGKATHEEMWVRVTKTKAGNATVLYSDSMKVSVLNKKDLVFKIPIDGNNDVGLYNYTVSINDERAPDEHTFANNRTTLQLYIAEDALVPVFPYDLSIVNQQNIELKASSLNPFAPASKFIMELDTSEYFNSPLKQTKNVMSVGGVIRWQIPFQMVDSTVYYWRTAVDSLVNGKIYWNNSSFIYLANGSDGWNQSHFFQYKKDDSVMIAINEPDRIFKGKDYFLTLTVQARTFGHGGESSIFLNNDPIGFGSCLSTALGRQGVLFVLFDPVTGEPMENTNQFAGAAIPCSQDRKHQFEFTLTDTTRRRQVMDFIDAIPNNYYVVMRASTYSTTGQLASAQEWMDDQAYWGPGVSLYHSLLNLGFPNLLDIQGRVPYAGVAQKGNTGFTAELNVGALETDLVNLEVDLPFESPGGHIKSTVIGPAAKWEQLLWKATSHLDNIPANDRTSITVYGLSASGAVADSLFTTTEESLSLGTIDAVQYPYLQLKWYAEDSTTLTLPQLKYWRVLHQPLPEAALNPLAGFEFKDSLIQGEELNLKVAVENLRALPMDSMLIRYRLIDAGNTSRVIAEKRYKPLEGNDTLMADLNFNPQQYVGQNHLFIEVNPDKDQPEHYHPNNLGYLPFFVKGDAYAPLVDVTFDGVHILNNDLVSAKPLINILIKDENKFSPINDTSRTELVLMDQQTRIEERIPFDGNICRFIPASGGEKNEARIEFKPTLDDGTYTLKVVAKDNVGNISGNVPHAYQISFEVENKSTITNVLNYPNPFSTSTQFIFTLTGSEVPHQFKIQIISVTGKVVREITKAELGNIRVGRNMTEYRWDGRDQFGQLLGNGVYLYRVITSNSDGEAIERRANAKIDKFFKNDYGKLYIMR